MEQRGDSTFQSVECCACNEQTESEVKPECYVKVAQDETAINSDLGLYYEFQVGEGGIPLNCPGAPMDKWNVDILADASLDALSGAEYGGVNTWDNEPNCPRNNAKDAGDAESLSDYVEKYGADQNVWANDFIAAFEKLLTTGYEPSKLQAGPEVLGFGKTTCGQYKVKGTGWNYGCQLAESEADAGSSSGGGTSSGKGGSSGSSGSSTRGGKGSKR